MYVCIWMCMCVTEVEKDGGRERKGGRKKYYKEERKEGKYRRMIFLLVYLYFLLEGR